jgi:transposase
MVTPSLQEKSPMALKAVGIDLAKNVFQLHGVDDLGAVVLRRRVQRAQLLETVAQLPSCLIGVEASNSAYYWAERFERMGHMVKIISPNYVKPFRRSQKNDGNDAEAICTALQQPYMRFVPKRSVEQQDIQALHRARQRLVNHRTALASQIRGFLRDRGIVFAQSISRLRHVVPEVLEDAENELTGSARQTVAELYDFLREIDRRIAVFDRRIDEAFRASPLAQKIAKIEGVGPKISTAVVAAVGDGREFKNGRHMAAWLGLVPRQHSSGDRIQLFGISKRGDQHLRTLIVHGARAVVRTALKKSDPKSLWVNQLRDRRGFNKAVVAVANKNARVIWAVLRREEPYHKAA